MKRGELYWADLGGDAGIRPVAIVTRTDAIAVRSRVTIASISRTPRTTRYIVHVGTNEGLPHDSYLNCDELATVSKTIILRRIGALGRRKIDALDRALTYALGVRT